MPETLEARYAVPETVATVEGFTALDRAGLEEFIRTQGLAMDLDDALCCQAYFRDTEHRDPTITEVKMIDTYWSDHCRHTTFATQIDDVKIGCDYIAEEYKNYLKCARLSMPARTSR